MNQIKAGSHSRLSTFELCKLRAKLAFIDRIPEPPRPLPQGKTEQPNDRGTRVHTAAEMYVKGGVELVPELASFRAEMDRLRELHAEGRVSLEGDWAYDREWNPVAWMSYDAWMRVKCDAVVFMSSQTAVVIDYKTGKRWGNEIKHADQLKMYQLGAFLRYPKLRKVVAELWYTDLGETHPLTFTREQGMRALPKLEKRMLAMTSETEFKASPNIHSCGWCPYKPVDKGGTGHCPVGV